MGEEDILTIKRIVDYNCGDESGEYLVEEGSKAIGVIRALKNDALIGANGKGQINPLLDDNLITALRSGKIKKTDFDAIFTKSQPYCNCEPCTDRCEYYNAAR
ncbi:Uncharacterised protein [uncultured archaeon]|nr:Uncharacterised protein [uncultured archaeon]